MTKIIYMKEKNNEDILKECAMSIRNGGIVVLPTETVYGIGANALDKNAVEKIFEVKKRKKNNPLIVLVSDIDMLKCIVKEINSIHKTLIENFWPGPLTIVFDKNDILPDNVSGGYETIGIRIPGNTTAINLIKQSGVPITAPSANISGMPSITDPKVAYEVFDGKVDYIIDDGISTIGIESTIVRVETDVVNILRCGKILPEDIEKLGLVVKISSDIPSKNNKHYDIGKNSIIVAGNEKEILEKINKYLKKNLDKKIGMIGFDEHYDIFSSKIEKYIKMGSINNYDEILKRLFNTLNEAQKTDVDIFLIESLENSGIGQVIMNKLIEVSDNNFM